MNVISRAGTRATTADRVRAGAVVLAALVQTVAGGLGGSGFFGESQRVLADRYPSPLMPATAAFSIWSLIYLALLALAVRQALPSQQGRPVHRATGWWFVASALFNAGWIVAFSQELVPLSQVVIVALLVCLAVMLHRLGTHPAEGIADRVLLHGPIGLYAGWVAVATVVGGATTGTFLGLDVTVVAGAVVLLLAGAAIAFAASRTAVAVPFAASVLWALFWIVAEAATPVVVVALLAGVAVIAVVGYRAFAGASERRTVAAFG
ncbi:TspO/MBR related protein [Pseudonocardia sediminis]|uniref:TspO/MBR related protein n=1 Tax=Pseudonocardia sediminis TaxID=1397368 RepID=A0A4V2FQ81_PSEST|nr:tryptophan-rich sensory protein [Pseudonocardia sediminis]RZT83740.1 TspO/MBR related protein [Pseudonocardia sediminis]